MAAAGDHLRERPDPLTLEFVLHSSDNEEALLGDNVAATNALTRTAQIVDQYGADMMMGKLATEAKNWSMGGGKRQVSD